MLKVIELFAGIGSQTQALKDAKIEHEVVGISEIDKYALKLYEILHGKVENFGDITQIKNLPQADLWTYSFPCTNISLVGDLTGFKGKQSSLLFEVKRLLLTSPKPKYLLLENVKMLLSKRFKKDFDEWLKFLSTLGYKNFYKVLNSKDYGIPQNRERVFCVSILDKKATFEFPKPIPLKFEFKDILEQNVDKKYYLSDKLIKCFTSTKNRNGFNRAKTFRPLTIDGKICWTLTTRAGTRSTDNYVKYGEDIIRKLTPNECFILMGWKQPELDKIVGGGISNVQLYKTAGNAIVVDVLKYIFIELFKIESIEGDDYDE